MSSRKLRSIEKRGGGLKGVASRSANHYSRSVGWSTARDDMSHFNPQSRKACTTGRSSCPFFVSRYARRLVPSSAGTCSTILCCRREISRSLKMFVGMPSGEPLKSRNRLRPSSRSRMTSSVQRSPRMSSEQEIGHGERRAGERRAFDRVAMTLACYHAEYLHSTSNITCILQAICHAPAMTAELEIKLAAPGAGLPGYELLVGRLMFALQRAISTRAAVNERFEQERKRIRLLLQRLEASQAARRVLIARLRGLEDSSRYWSMWMTLDHLRIVHGSITQVIRALANNKLPPGVASTAAVKPSPALTAAVVEAYEQSCDELLATVQGVPDLRTRLRYAHPWFGPLDAAGWHALSARHIAIHRRQIEGIIDGLNPTGSKGHAG